MRSVCCADRSMSRSETMPTFRNLFVPLSPRLVVAEGVFMGLLVVHEIKGIKESRSSVPSANALCPVDSVKPANNTLNSEWHRRGKTSKKVS